MFLNYRLISGSLLICALIAVTEKYIEEQFQTLLEWGIYSYSVVVGNESYGVGYFIHYAQILQ